MACALISFYFRANGMLIVDVASAFASRESLMEPITFSGKFRFASIHVRFNALI